VAYLFTLLAFPVRAIGWVLNELPRSVVGWDRVQRVLTATGAQEQGTSALPADGGATAVSVEAVSFSYADAQVLREVAFDVQPGRTVALVGPTGSGKSTLASVLVRLLDPSSGAVTYDDLDVRELGPGALAQVAALVPQATFLFDDTVRGNITLGADIPDEDVWAALRIAQGDGFVAALPKALDTVVGERGTTLSGGQRQRLALARAVVRRPRLLVLDDATSSVDPSVEQRILAGLRDAGLPSTVVVVAYRRATIALADEVVFVEDGRVAARGTHEQLLEVSSGYQDLVHAYERAELQRQADALEAAGEHA
jgi:ABC-type multidrug transport system fused ATPase/permease subunit